MLLEISLVFGYSWEGSAWKGQRGASAMLVTVCWCWLQLCLVYGNPLISILMYIFLDAYYTAIKRLFLKVLLFDDHHN